MKSFEQPRPKALSLNGLLEVASALVGLATLAGFLGKCWWIFELTTHFRPHLAVVAGIFAVLWAIKRRWRWTMFTGATAAINIGLVLALFWPPKQTATGQGTHLRLVSVNLHASNTHTELALEFLKRMDADVVLLMEVNERWMKALTPLRDRYPEVIAELREDDFGIALLSRVAATNSQVIYPGEAEVPSISTTLLVGGQAVRLLGTHPLPPGSAEYANGRNQQLREIAALARKANEPMIVLGDLNVTPWSPFFTELLRAGGLQNTSQGRGLFASWPADLPLGRIPIDHCLITPNLKVRDKQTGPQIGSDHLPLIVELEVPKP